MRLVDADALLANRQILRGEDVIGIRDYVTVAEIENAPTIEPEPCEDAVSRADIVDMLEMYPFTEYSEYEAAREVVKRLPPVTPKTEQPEIIRCKECKCRDEKGYCTRLRWTVTDKWSMWWKVDDMGYCCLAERREDD